MLGFSKKIRNRFRFAKHWNLALDEAAKGRYAEALEALRIAGEVSKPDAEFYALFAFLKFATDDDIGLAALLMKGLSNGVFSNTSADTRYLKAYVLWLGHLSRNSLGREALRGLKALPESDLDDIDLAAVSGHLKRNFPLTDHPNWKFQGHNA